MDGQSAPNANLFWHID